MRSFASIDFKAATSRAACASNVLPAAVAAGEVLSEMSAGEAGAGDAMLAAGALPCPCRQAMPATAIAASSRHVKLYFMVRLCRFCQRFALYRTEQLPTEVRAPPLGGRAC